MLQTELEYVIMEKIRECQMKFQEPEFIVLGVANYDEVRRLLLSKRLWGSDISSEILKADKVLKISYMSYPVTILKLMEVPPDYIEIIPRQIIIEIERKKDLILCPCCGAMTGEGNCDTCGVNNKNNKNNKEA